MTGLDCQRVAGLLQAWDDMLVLCHASPDGDTLGAASALVRGLRALGKRADLFCADPIDPKFHFLFAGLGREHFTPAHILSVDVADPALLGEAEEAYAGCVELAIDHHSSHKDFAQYQWVEPAAAACELVYRLLGALGAPIDKATADCLYTGVATDTGCFRYSNVTPGTLRVAAGLLELGADAAAINRAMFETKSRAQVQAERLVMAGMRFSCGGRCALVQVPQAIYRETGAREGELDGVAALPRQIEGVLVGVTLKEKPDGTIKASLRSNPPASACAICEKFGGGGHTCAAGCSFSGITMEEAARRLEAACQEHLRGLGPL